MIYIAILLYLLYLTIRYDVLEFNAYKHAHFIVVIIILICVSGFRYRLGTDTYAYEVKDFEKYSNISNLTIKEFDYFRVQPTWVLINSLGRSLGGFVYVQIITSVIHIGLWGYVIKRICPTLLFTSLFIYYIFDFTLFNMEVMREGMAVSLFLCSLVALNDRKYIRYLLFTIAAYLFHSFSLIASFSFFVFYFLMSRNAYVSVASILIVAVVCISNKNIIVDMLLETVMRSSDTTIAYAANYATSQHFGESDYNWKGLLTRFSLPVVYGYMLYKTRGIFAKYVNIEWRIFMSAIFLSMIFMIMVYALVIVGRMYNYFHLFTYLLIALYLKSLYNRFSCPIWRIRCSACLLFVPFFFATMDNLRADILADTEKNYSRYYPYSSVFDKSIDKKREVIMMNKIWMID